MAVMRGRGLVEAQKRFFYRIGGGELATKRGGHREALRRVGRVVINNLRAVEPE